MAILGVTLFSTPIAAQQVPVFDPQAETEAYLSRMSPEERARSDAYIEGGYWLQLIGLVYGLGVAWFLLGSGLSRRLRDAAERITRFSFARSSLYIVGYTLITFVLGFPLTLYQSFIREHRYQLATQSFGPWMKDQLVGLAVGLVMGAVALSLLYVAIRKAGRHWWLWGAVGGVAFLIFTILISPVFIAPLFNTYQPLEDASVKTPILTMARANGVPASEVYQFDASQQSKRISANVSGFLATMRISLNDNLLERCSLAEIKSVMGHEIGHYALNHVYEHIMFFGILLAGGMAFLHWSFARAHQRWGEGFGIRDIGDIAGLPLLGALFSLYIFVMTPVINTHIRTNEAEADIFGLNAAREPDGFAEVALKLGEYRKLDPGPIEEFLLFDHPSGRARIEMAMKWKAENLSPADAPLPQSMEQ